VPGGNEWPWRKQVLPNWQQRVASLLCSCYHVEPACDLIRYKPEEDVARLVLPELSETRILACPTSWQGYPRCRWGNDFPSWASLPSSLHEPLAS
jgi:hypothetical protein